MHLKRGKIRRVTENAEYMEVLKTPKTREGSTSQFPVCSVVAFCLCKRDGGVLVSDRFGLGLGWIFHCFPSAKWGRVPPHVPF